MDAAQQVVNLISLAENELFSGSFSESTVKSDLSSRPEKRSFYIQEFGKWEESMDTVLGMLRGNPTAREFISKAEKNKSQARKMLAYVRSA